MGAKSINLKPEVWRAVNTFENDRGGVWPTPAYEALDLNFISKEFHLEVRSIASL